VRRCLLFTITALLASSHFTAEAIPQKFRIAAAPPSERPAPSLALSPAVIMIKAKPGASSTHALTITNLTYGKSRFVMEAFDVVTQDGKRVFVPAGETSGGIARSTIFNPPTVEVNPGESAQVNVTLTVPPEPGVRAVVAIFHGQTAVSGNGNLLVAGSLGTLITYSLSDKIAVRTGAPIVKPQTETSNLTLSEPLENCGQEPVVIKGTLAILKNSGQLIGRVTIESHRLLPGEKFDSVVEYPNIIQRGQYRAMISFVHEGGVQTSNVEFQVQ
jgi:hypothetical protein